MWGLVVAKINELGVAKDAAGCPFGEFDFGDNLGFEPDIVFHVFGGDSFAPMTGSAAGEVCKRALRRGKRPEYGENLATRRGIQTVANFAGEQKFFLLIIADED